MAFGNRAVGSISPHMQAQHDSHCQSCAASIAGSAPRPGELGSPHCCVAALGLPAMLAVSICPGAEQKARPNPHQVVVLCSLHTGSHGLCCACHLGMAGCQQGLSLCDALEAGCLASPPGRCRGFAGGLHGAGHACSILSSQGCALGRLRCSLGGLHARRLVDRLLALMQSYLSAALAPSTSSPAVAAVHILLALPA